VVTNASLWDALKLLPPGVAPLEWRQEQEHTPGVSGGQGVSIISGLAQELWQAYLSCNFMNINQSCHPINQSFVLVQSIKVILTMPNSPPTINSSLHCLMKHWPSDIILAMPNKPAAIYSSLHCLRNHWPIELIPAPPYKPPAVLVILTTPNELLTNMIEIKCVALNCSAAGLVYSPAPGY
jgi:hypothetical protein